MRYFWLRISRKSPSRIIEHDCYSNNKLYNRKSYFPINRNRFHRSAISVELAIFHRVRDIAWIIAMNRSHLRKISPGWPSKWIECAVQLDNEGMQSVDAARSSKCNQGPCTSINNEFFVVTDVRASNRPASRRFYSWHIDSIEHRRYVPSWITFSPYLCILEFVYNCGLFLSLKLWQFIVLYSCTSGTLSGCNLMYIL